MRKTYMKPEVVIERFLVNEYVAGNCGASLIVNHTEETCTIEVDDTIFFGAACQAMDGINVPNPGNGGTICYHSPGNEWNFFSS